MPRFTVLLFPAHEGGYYVRVPELAGISTQGETRDEAIAMAEDAIRLCLEVMAEDGEPIPEEVGQPEMVSVEVPSPISVS